MHFLAPTSKVFLKTSSIFLDFKIKKFHTFSGETFFLYFGKWSFLIFSQKNVFSHISGNGSFLYFSENKFSLYLRKRDFLAAGLRKILYFLKKSFLIFWKIELFKETSYISRWNFLSWKNKKKDTLKKFLIFWKIWHQA